MTPVLSVGIVGLPNVGKSTLFNALTAGHANVSNYPFTTIDGNVGMVPVPDARLAELERLLEPEKATPCSIEFIDIAGLVEGASRGEGLGNQFLGNIRSVDAIVHVLRCFREADVAHVYEDVDPVRDAQVVETELLLADLEVLTRAMEKQQRVWKTSPRDHAHEEERWRLYREKLQAGVALRTLELDREGRRELKGLGLITGKPVLFAANVSEDEFSDREADVVGRIRDAVVGESGVVRVIEVSARIEWELQQLEPEERRAYLDEMGRSRSGLEALVEEAFELLGLVRFYTVAKNKLQAWEIESGTSAVEAAGKVHTDMERGFIRAQVARYEDLHQHGSLPELQHRGLVRTEGRDYAVQDGDVVEFLFQA